MGVGMGPPLLPLLQKAALSEGERMELPQGENMAPLQIESMGVGMAPPPPPPLL